MMVDNSLSGFYVAQNGHFKYLNSRLAEILGYERPDQLLGKSFRELVHPDDWPLPESGEPQRERAQVFPSRYRFRCLKKDGSSVWVNTVCTQATYLGQPADIGNVVEITALKRVEEQLRESEKNVGNILEKIEDGYFEGDLAGNHTFFNTSLCKIFGYSEDELMGMNYRKLMSAEMSKKVYQTFNRAYRTGIPDKGFDYEMLRKDGTKIAVEVSVSLKKDSEGRRAGFRCILRDVTERRRIEQERERYRSHLEAVFGGVKDAIITVDPEMRVIAANQATENICGLARQEIIGKVFTDCQNYCNNACDDVLKQTLNRKTTVREYQSECRHEHRPEQVVIFNSSPLRDRDGNFMGAVLVIRDITRLRVLERELRERHQFHNIIGKSTKMKEIYGLLEDLADLETTVLITGESGTGKGLVAEALHFSGRRAFKPLIKVNCSALAENLLESELFGHVKGAFTGAISDKQGRFQAADGGTILLDEIGDVSPRIQLKLLRVLEEKEFERVGESILKKVDIRVIACTNANLREKVKMGEFREDLYYRLKVVDVSLPPLRERIQDIPLLVDHFCNMFNKEFKRNTDGVSEEVLQAFFNYHWPGNVRELRHSLERAFILCRGKIVTLDHIPSEIRAPLEIGSADFGMKPTVGHADLLNALNKTDWNKAKAARLLGIHRSTLYRKIHKHTLAKPTENA